MRKIHCINAISKYGTDQFTEDYQLTDEVNEAEGILVRSASLHEMQFSNSLLAIARAGAGVNNIPLDACAQEGIVVFNTPGANANGVKELVLAGLFLASRDIVGGIEWCKENKEDANIAKSAEKAKKAFAGCEIKGKKLGVVGLGAIGAEVANAAIALGMEVYGYDPYISVNAAWRLSRDVKHTTSLDTICQECDYITLHVPAVDSTKGMINKAAIDQMKDGVVILNFARDVLVNEDDLAEALKSGKVKKYVTDFANPKSVAMENTIVIPHLGASTEESEDNCAKMAVYEITEYLEKGTIRNSVNFPNLKVPYEGGYRVCLIHKNIPNMIASITSAVHTNIENMGNRSRGDYAYTIIDLADQPNEDTLAALRAIDGMISVRAI